LPDRRIIGKIGRVIADIIDILKDRNATLAISSYTVVMWGMALLQIYLFFAAIGAHIPLLDVLFRMPVAMLVGQIPATLSGIGTRDGAMLYLFSGLTGMEQIVAAGFLFTVFRYWVPAVAGLPFTVLENRRSLVAKKS